MLLLSQNDENLSENGSKNSKIRLRARPPAEPQEKMLQTKKLRSKSWKTRVFFTFRLPILDGRVHEQVSSVLFFTVFFEGERHDLSKTGGFGRKMPPPGKPVTFYECHPEDHAPAPSVRADFQGNLVHTSWTDVKVQSVQHISDPYFLFFWGILSTSIFDWEKDFRRLRSQPPGAAQMDRANPASCASADSSMEGGSKNRDAPKLAIFIGFSIVNHPFWGTSSLRNSYYWTWFHHISSKLIHHRALLVRGAHTIKNLVDPVELLTNCVTVSLRQSLLWYQPSSRSNSQLGVCCRVSLPCPPRQMRQELKVAMEGSSWPSLPSRPFDTAW